MGIFSTTLQPSGPLEPFSPPLGVDLSFCMPTETVLILREKLSSWSGDDFEIKDSHGTVALLCSGSARSILRNKKEIKDSSGRVLFKLENKANGILADIHATSPEDKLLFKMQAKWGWGSKMIGTFTNTSDNSLVTLYLEGDMFGGSAEIRLGEKGTQQRPVATITRKSENVGKSFAREYLGAQTYQVAIPAGVDISLIASFCIAFDEAFNERH